MFGHKSKKTDNELLEQFQNTPVDESWLKAGLIFIGETVKVVVLAAAIILPIRYFLIQPFYVKGASMEPTFFDREYLMINEIKYHVGTPRRGEVVVFRYPNDPKQYFIKRIIGLPGETVQIKNGSVYLYDDKTDQFYMLDESGYLVSEVETLSKIANRDTYSLGQDEYFVLGDNRQHSLDSRVFGPVPKSLVIGEVWFRGWPIDRIKVFN